MTNLVRIADRVLNRPLMIMPDKLAIISSVLEGRLGVEAVAPAADVPVPDATRHVGTFEMDPTSSTGGKKPYRTTADGVAVIPIIGSLVGRGGWLSAASGITSYENLKFQISAAAADNAVKSIVLDIDSPGGEAVGAFEVADVVRAASLQKEVVAVPTGLCCSAAYAIASAASSIVTTKSSVLGSIGVVMLHADYSHALHERGVVPTLIHAGKRKVDGSPYAKLTDEVRDNLRAEVEKFQSLFVATVALGRKGLSEQAIRAMEAATYIGADAVKAGLADEVGSLEQTLSRLSNGARASTPAHSPGPSSSLQLVVPTAPKPAATAPCPATIPTKPISAPPPPAPAGASWNDVIAEINGKKPPSSPIGDGRDQIVAAPAISKARPGPTVGFGWDAVIAELNKEVRR